MNMLKSLRSEAGAGEQTSREAKTEAQAGVAEFPSLPILFIMKKIPSNTWRPLSKGSLMNDENLKRKFSGIVWQRVIIIERQGETLHKTTMDFYSPLYRENGRSFLECSNWVNTNAGDIKDIVSFGPCNRMKLILRDASSPNVAGRHYIFNGTNIRSNNILRIQIRILI